MKVSTIYIATNIVNNKCYVGFTSRSLEVRKERHKTESFSVTQPGYKSAFHDAIRKYGWDNFKWEVLYQSWDRYHCKNVMENYFIEECGTYSYDHDGYNMTKGGEGTFGHHMIHTPESNLKRSLTMKGKNTGPRTEQEKINISNGRKGIPAWNEGKTGYLNTDSIEKIKVSAKIRVVCPHCNKESNRGNAGRWHFDNCKMKGV